MLTRFLYSFAFCDRQSLLRGLTSLAMRIWMSLFLETIDAALQLFTLGRLDFAMSDTYFLHVNERMNSQVSENSLLDTNIHVYIHPRCSQGLESFIIVNG